MTRRGLALSVSASAIALAIGSVRSGVAYAQAGDGRDAFSIASADPRFRTFTSIVHRSGLEPSARGTQPFTVFMPTEAAFDRYPELRASLLGPASEAFPDTHALVVFVRAHVLLGLHPTPPLGERKERVMTRVGTMIDIINTTPPTISWQSSGGRTGTATLSEAPIIASNALIYPIDNPILLVSPSDAQ
ncbi:MAG TPA: fasciclin domain-containing protein [Acetobacteraceae bacterium]